MAERSAVPALPPGWRLHPSSDLRHSHDWSLLFGGSPTTLMRLSTKGSETAKRLLGSAPLSDDPAEGALARRLEQAGMAAAEPPSTTKRRVSIVIPYHNDRVGIDRTLAALSPAQIDADTGLIAEIVVVDDCSDDPLTLASPATSVIRHATNRGPAAARNTGAARATQSTIVFLDAGASIGLDQLAALVPFLDDDRTSVVAPRIRSTDGGSASISSYERSRSPLDLGPRPSIVKPLTRLSYVPSTCLAVDAALFAAAGGFDEQLRFGEDVDLVWRLAETTTVRYVSSIEAAHPARSSLRKFIRQRRSYGSSAAPLASRHRGNTAPLFIDRWTAATIALVGTSHPFLAIGVAAWRARLLTRSLPEDLQDRGALATMLVTQGQILGIRGVVESATRPYWPIALGIVLVSPTKGVALIAASIAARARSARSFSSVGLSVVDDVAYSAGVWQNAIRHRSMRCLIPNWS